jgi:trigger factor
MPNYRRAFAPEEVQQIMEQRPPIPAAIKREVRQRCGFGCVICGLPIYEYDHKPGFANTLQHRADEITLLCPNHHAEKTKGLLPKGRVEEADRNPLNRRQSDTSIHSLWFSGFAPEIVLGKLLFTCEDSRRPTVMIPVLVRGYAPIGFTLDSNGLMLNVDARDSTNKSVLLIKESELILSTGVWDATFVGQSLRIWDTSGSLSIDLKFAPPNRIIFLRYHTITMGISIDIDPTKIELRGDNVPNLNVMGDGIVCANIGVLVGAAPFGLGVGILAGQ